MLDCACKKDVTALQSHRHFNATSHQWFLLSFCSMRLLACSIHGKANLPVTTPTSQVLVKNVGWLVRTQEGLLPRNIRRNRNHLPLNVKFNPPSWPTQGDILRRFRRRRFVTTEASITDSWDEDGLARNRTSAPGFLPTGQINFHTSSHTAIY
jgi:hypothetical protein